jgi:hypothetical protein
MLEKFVFVSTPSKRNFLTSSCIACFPTKNVLCHSLNAARAAAGDGYHFVLSKSQEDEIREHFLIDKLKNYTQVRLAAT